MKVTIKYQNSVIAKEFGCYSLEEVVILPDTAKYVDILNLLKEKYKAAHPKIDGKVLEKKFPDEFIIHCKKGIIRQIEDKPIDTEEVMVRPLIAGG
jgi:hypothetical protein